MRFAAILVAGALSLGGPAAAAPYDDFFDYDGPRRPAAGDCDAIAAELGPGATWFGEFAGRRYDTFHETYRPFSAQGCFESERACRIWQQQAISFLDRGPIVYTRCTPGLG